MTLRRRPRRVPPVPGGQRRRPGRRRRPPTLDRRGRRPPRCRTAAPTRTDEPASGSRASRSTSRSAAGSSTRSCAGAARRRPGGRRDRPDARARRGPRPGRRVGQRQDDDRPGHRQADPPDRRDAILFEGEDVSDLWAGQALRDYRRRVQLIFQDPYETLNPKQTIHDFVAEPLVVNGIGTAEPSARRRSSRRSRRPACGPATDFAFRYPHELSGGQRQRVVIAGALVMDPEVIVADEPVSMLDVSIRTELLRLMLDLREERGLTYLFITHDLSLAWVIADRIAVMYLGKIMEIGPAERGHPRAAQPVHAGARVGVAVARSARRRATRAQPDDPRRRDARRGAHPDRLPVPSALPDGVRSLSRSRSRRCSTSAAASRRRAGWPSPVPDATGVATRSATRPAGRDRAGPSVPAGPRPSRRRRRPSRVTDDRRRSRRCRPPIADLLAASAATVVAELRALGAEGGWRPAPGEWSANECVGHLIEAERRGFAGRIRRSSSPTGRDRTAGPREHGIRRRSPRRGATTSAIRRGARRRSSWRCGRTASRSFARSRPADLGRVGHPSRGRAAARRRAARRVGPPRSQPRPPDAGGHARPASGARWATPAGSASRTSDRTVARRRSSDGSGRRRPSPPSMTARRPSR